MLLKRFYDDALAQASFLLGDTDTHEALVVDPNRDVDAYLHAAAVLPDGTVVTTGGYNGASLAGVQLYH